MTAPRLPLIATLSLLVFLVAIAAPLRAQDAPPPPPERAQDRQSEDDPQIDPERLRHRLERMLEQTEASAARIRTALETLDSGGSVRDAIDQLGGPTRVRQWSEEWARWNDGDRDDPGRGRPDGPPEINRERVLEFLGKHAPELAARIRAVRAEDERRAEFFIARLTPRVAEILAAEDRDPELADILTREFKVGMALLDLGGQLAKARESGDEAAIEEIRPKLKDLAAEQVDLRLLRREHEIATLAERIEALRLEAEEQRDRRDRLIDEVVDRMLEEGRPDGPERDGRRQRRQGRP